MLKRSVLMVFCVFVVGPAWSASGALVGWWPFDEGTGTVASDATGNGNDATFNGDPQWGDGQLGGALEFDGSGDWLECADGGTLAIGEAVSVAAWIKVNALGIDHKIGGNQDFANGGYKMSIYMNNKVEFEIRTASNVAVLNRDVAGGTVLEMDTWYHVFGVYSQQEGYVRTYVNGVLDRDMATEEALGVSPGPLRLGCEPWNTGGNNFNGAMDDVRVYNHAVAEAEMPLIMLGGRLKELASNPEPADESEDIPRDLVLGWEPGVAAVTHDVYLGTVFEDVDGADRANPMGGLASQGQADSSFHPDGLLEFGQTYYWRVDEVNGAPDYAIFKGDIWSFTTEPFAYPVQNVIATTNGVSTDGTDPENTVNGSGLNAADEHSTSSSDMWQALPGVEPLQIQYEFDQVYKLHEMLVWNYNVQFELILGFGLKDVTVEYSVDSADWTALGDVVLAQATAKATYAANTTIDFGGVAAKYVRLTVNSGYGMMGQYGLSEVRFLYIPAHAREPLPTDGETGVDVVPVLSWRAGREAALHEVYVGTDREDLALVEITSEPEAELTGLEFGTMYYWRINEVSEAEAANSWEGNVWSFATREFAVVDDFESYTNADDGTRIFETWLDRWTNNTGATVGYLHIPFAEQSIVHSGGQSMPLTYDNSAAPFYSEAERDLDSMDWLANGADTLRLFVSGRSPAFYETAEGTIQTTGIGIDIWSTWDEFRYAYKSLTGDGSMIARVDSLDKSPSTWAKAGVMIRQSTGAGSQHSFMCMTGGDGNGASWQGRPSEGQASVNTDATDPVAPPYWVRIDRAGNTFTGFISADGQSWTQVGRHREVEMSDPVLIGLALTSHNANQATAAQFSNVSFTGDVTGAWQVAAIGVAQPEGNTPESIYVAVEDSAGRVAVVPHPDAAITARSGWTEWLIPYSDLTGIDLSNVDTMYIGVGDRNNPNPGGTGKVFIDDVEVGRPTPVVESAGD